MNRTIRWTGRILTALALAVFLAPAPGSWARDPVDLNTATVEELTELPGIGPAKAKAIVEYRSERPFERLDEFMNVPGIGPSTFDSLKDQVTVGSARDSR